MFAPRQSKLQQRAPSGATDLTYAAASRCVSPPAPPSNSSSLANSSSASSSSAASSFAAAAAAAATSSLRGSADRRQPLMSGDELEAAVSSALAARRKQQQRLDCAELVAAAATTTERNHVARRKPKHQQHPSNLTNNHHDQQQTHHQEHSPTIAAGHSPSVGLAGQLDASTWDEERGRKRQRAAAENDHESQVTATTGTWHRRDKLVSLSSSSSSGQTSRMAAPQQQQHHYYYSAATELPDQHPSQQQTGGEFADQSPLGNQRLVSGQQAYSSSNTMTNPSDLSDYHYYQVVVPEHSLSSSIHPNQQHHDELASQKVRQAQISSPRRSIQRIVSSLFSNQLAATCGGGNNNGALTQNQHYQIPTINQNLVISEPLIRSSSWQNKTLIDLRQQQQQQTPSVMQGTLPCGPRYTQWPPHDAAIELSNIQQQQQQQRQISEQEHLYSGVNTMQFGHSHRHLMATLGSGECLNQQSVQTQGSKTFCANGGYIAHNHHQPPQQHQHHVPPPPPWARDPRLESKLHGGQRASMKRCLAMMLLATIGCFLLAALFAAFVHREQQRRQAPSPASGFAATPVSLNELHHLPARTQANPPVIMYPRPQQPFLPPIPIQLPMPPVLATTPTATSEPTATTAPTATSTRKPASSYLEPSTQSYWSSAASIALGDGDEADEQWQPPASGSCHLSSADFACSLRGQCLGGQCLCAPGFSGPNCHIVNCPNACSQRGECKLSRESVFNQLAAGAASSRKALAEAHLYSFGYQTLANSAALHSQSVCPSRSLVNQVLNSSLLVDEGAQYNDQRLEWRCQCRAGFGGADCSQTMELNCDDGLDDDGDGLADCQDDDCCEKPACRDNLMCLQSPDPTRMVWDTDSYPINWFHEQRQLQQESLAKAQAAANPGDSETASHFRPEHNFYVLTRFLIKNGSVQSYAQDDVFDKSRVAIIRGRVIKARAGSVSARAASDRGVSGNVNVRVSVVESLRFGFTLTRNDGYFDMLVNGDEWITLQFHRNTYVPVKRKILVKAHSINVLGEDVEMWPSSGSGQPADSLAAPATSSQQQQEFAAAATSSRSLGAPTFNVQSKTELYRLVAAFRRDVADERRRNLLFDCLSSSLVEASAGTTLASQHEPMLIVGARRPSNHSGRQPLRTFVLASEGAFQTALNESAPEGEHPKIHLLYNSATFAPAYASVKSTLAIKLLSDRFQISAQRGGNKRVLNAIVIQMDIEGQAVREKLTPLAGLVYRFAWDRRNAYGQKVYGFAPLRIRVGYEYELRPSKSAASIWLNCTSSADLFHSPAADQLTRADTSATTFETFFSSKFSKQLVWFETRVHMEAHPMNQHSDVGKWTLATYNRFDPGRNLVYFATGWSLPFGLVYPPILADPISLAPANDHHREPVRAKATPNQRLMSRGPNSSMFVIIGDTLASGGRRLVQLDASGSIKLFDLPLDALTGQFNLRVDSGEEHERDDTQILYNNFQSTLYLSSRVAGKMVQIGYPSLMVLNKTLNSGSATSSAEDEIDIEQLCGFGRQSLSSTPPSESLKPSRLVKLAGPHSMTLDETNQVLYFIDGSSSLMALDLNSHRVALLQPTPAITGSRRVQQSANAQTSGECHHRELESSFSRYKPGNIHSLTWSQADSSLYFIDRRLVLALRQDLTLEPVALGDRHYDGGDEIYDTDCQQAPILGRLKTLSADETNNDLLIVHEWLASDNAQKEVGRLYLAKAKLGMRTNGGPIRWPHRLIDLHSAASAWDPLILRVAEWRSSSGGRGERREIDGPSEINWHELANPQLQAAAPAGRGQPPLEHSAGGSSLSSSLLLAGAEASGRVKPIPFIHLGRGFERTDSIEINSDGSIFVLDSSAHSITRIVAYKPASGGHNLVERFDSNLGRVFVTNNLQIRPDWPSAATLRSGGAADDERALPTNGSATVNDIEDRKLNVLIVQNPINKDLMEFHLGSGLQIALSQLDSNKTEFYYTILVQTTSGVEAGEDDKYDVDVQRAMFNYIILSGEANRDGLLSEILDAQVRVNSIHDHSYNNDYLFSRTQPAEGQKYLLNNILTNSSLIFTLDTDAAGALTEFRGPDVDQSGRTQLIYHGDTHLLRDIIQGSKFKRVVYDRLFNHYCDLFQSNK